MRLALADAGPPVAVQWLTLGIAALSLVVSAGTFIVAFLVRRDRIRYKLDLAVFLGVDTSTVGGEWPVCVRLHNTSQRELRVRNVRLRVEEGGKPEALNVAPGELAPIQPDDRVYWQIPLADVLTYMDNDPYRKIRALVTVGEGQSFESKSLPLVRSS